MKKIVLVYLSVGALINGTMCFAEENAKAETNITVAENEIDNADFEKLSEPKKSISGCFVGVGVTYSGLSHSGDGKKTVTQIPANPPANPPAGVITPFSLSANENFIDYSLLLGFGSSILKDYYVGLEVEPFFRSQSSESASKDQQILRESYFGYNSDVRFGRMFSSSGLMPFVTLGFSRVWGTVTFDRGAHKSRFGSFYPSVGCGLEYKLNNNWSARGDFRYNITTADNITRSVATAHQITTHAAKIKPKRFALRLAIIRSL